MFLFIQKHIKQHLIKKITLQMQYAKHGGKYKSSAQFCCPNMTEYEKIMLWHIFVKIVLI